MGISAINDSKLDLQSTLEVRDDQAIFKAVLPLLAKQLTVSIVHGAIAIVAFKLNFIVATTFATIAFLYNTAVIGSTVLAIRSSKNVVEYNEIIETVTEKGYKSYLIIIIIVGLFVALIT